MYILNKYYKNIIVQDLIYKFNIINLNNIPKIKKITVIFKSRNFKKFISYFLILELITLQKSCMLKNKKSANNTFLTLKKGNIVGGFLIVRKSNMYLFFFKIIKIFIKNSFYLKLKKKNFLNSFSFNLKKLILFTEIENNYKFFNQLKNLEITITVFSNSLNEFLYLLYSFKIFK